MHTASDPEEDQAAGCRNNIGGTMVVKETLALHHPVSEVRNSTLSTHTPIESSATSLTRQAPVDFMAIERGQFLRLGFSLDTTSTVLVSRKPTTTWIYNTVWKTFYRWCRCKAVNMIEPLVKSAILSRWFIFWFKTSKSTQVSHCALICLVGRTGTICAPSYFRWGNIAKSSTGNYLVLTALTKPSFELREVALKRVCLKTIFLVALTLARRISEMGGLSSNPNICIFYKDKLFFSWIQHSNQKYPINSTETKKSICHPVLMAPHRKTSAHVGCQKSLKSFLIRTQHIRSEFLFINIHLPN